MKILFAFNVSGNDNMDNREFQPLKRRKYKTMNLLTHCGAQHVAREELFSVPAPSATETYCPIPHHLFVEQVYQSLIDHGYTVDYEDHALTRDGSRYFGTLHLPRTAVLAQEPQGSRDYSWLVGLRNSHDKSFPAGLVVGSRVFVCDNLAFCGEIVVARRHTVHILRDLRQLVNDAIARLNTIWQKQDQQFAVYRSAELSDPEAHDLIIRALEFRVITSKQITHIVREWKCPRHPEFAQSGKTAWRLFNGFTEIMKSTPDFALPGRTRRLHELLDNHLKVRGV
jgi:Domain of unknown function (DUF932)